MTSTITEADAAKITAWLETHELPSGLGTEESACSAASINLALGLGLTDECPPCASPSIWRWIIRVQDAMPGAMRNSAEWKRLLPMAAGTGRLLEEQCAAVALNWMWSVVLPQLQPMADKRGFGAEWLAMTTEKTPAAANIAKRAAAAAAVAYAAAYAAATATEFWATIDPCKCLADMIAVSE